ncbi:DUF4148 domain-containing protein [Undibacterium arcticum]|uniref:DUF4148 domain-containing protein n=1 Tax=Undibacterium arcticum TaxID=1762892 RepID=A0ABV7EY87_9BURK
MKIRHLIAAVIALSAVATVGSTFAERYSDEPVAVSTKTRAEVQAELAQARAEGLLMNPGEGAYPDELTGPNIGARGVAGSRYSGRTRAEVRAELEQARAQGLLINSGEGAYMGEWTRPNAGARGGAGSR